jgi:hypothetical protein
VTGNGYNGKSMSCHYNQHEQCATGAGDHDWSIRASCKCLCHVSHRCMDCGVLLDRGQPWKRCVSCTERNKVVVLLQARQHRIEFDLAEPHAIEAVEAHRRILTMIGGA